MTSCVRPIHPPAYVCRVLDALERAGWEAWLVGGCVRDSLLGRSPQDYDLTTNAPPERVQGLFPVVIPTGLAFGGVTVVDPEGAVEVTSYRWDRDYSDGRHPDRVTLGATLEEDAARRDFTIGALYWNPRRGLADPTGQGIRDLEQGILRAVGEPERRFTEDALRVLRAIRFSAQLGFALEEKTREALSSCASGLVNVSRERITAELVKLLCSPRPQAAALLEECGAWEVLFGPDPDAQGLDGRTPSTVDAEKAETPKDWGLTARVPARESLRLAAFCLGTGLPFGRLCGTLRLPKAVSRRTAAILSLCRRRPQADPLWLKMRLTRFAPEVILDALDLWQGWTGEDRSPARRALAQVLETREPYRLEDLAIGGRDLADLGVPPRERGDCLKALRVLCLMDPRNNRRDFLLRQAALLCTGMETRP